MRICFRAISELCHFPLFQPQLSIVNIIHHELQYGSTFRSIFLSIAKRPSLVCSLSSKYVMNNENEL